MTRQADHLDQAGELTQQLTDAYVSNARANAAPQQVQREDGSWPSPNCAEESCGVPLPEGRLRAGRRLCIDCQKDLERRTRR